MNVFKQSIYSMSILNSKSPKFPLILFYIFKWAKQGPNNVFEMIEQQRVTF